jgi:ABC-2 type transport system permease protein
MTTLARTPSAAVLPAVWKLLILRLRITINSFRHAKRRRKFLTILGMVGLLALAVFIFWLSWLLLGFLRSPELSQYTGFDPTPFLDAVPVLIFSGMFLGTLLTSFGVLLQALYLSGDMDFLLAAPVPIRAVFTTKLLQAVLPNLGLLALFGLPVLYGLGASRGYNFLYYPLVLITMLVLALAAAGLASLLVMLVVRIFPARRVAEVLGFFGATFSILCSQSWNLMQVSHRGEDISSEQLNSAVNLLMRFNNPWIPLNWAGRGLVEFGAGHWVMGILLMALTLGLATAAYWFALVTAERWYYSGWAGMQIVARKKRPARAARVQPLSETPGNALIERLLPAPIRGLIIKDFTVMRRDLRNLSQLVTPIIFGIVSSVAFLRSGNGFSSGAGDAPQWLVTSFRALLAYGNVGLSLFVGWSLLNRLGSMAFSHEGKNFWMLKIAPLRARDLLTAKFLAAYLPALTLGWLFLIPISLLRGMTFPAFLYSLLITAMCLFGMTGILLSFGVAGANFSWEDPRRMNSGSIGCVGMILTVLFVPLTFGLFVGPLWFTSAFQLPDYYAYLAGAFLGVGFSLICALVPLWLVRHKVERLDEA